MYRKKGRDENTRRVSRYRKIVVKILKDYICCIVRQLK